MEYKPSLRIFHKIGSFLICHSDVLLGQIDEQLFACFIESKLVRVAYFSQQTAEHKEFDLLCIRPPKAASRQYIGMVFSLAPKLDRVAVIPAIAATQTQQNNHRNNNSLLFRLTFIHK